MMQTKFDIAIASVQGSEHSRIGQNNQDAMFVVQGEKYLCGCVADGCGSCPRSEVGAVMMTKLVAKWVPACLDGSPSVYVGRGLDVAKSMIVSSLMNAVYELADRQANETLGMDVGAFQMSPRLATVDGILATSMLATSFGFYACDEFVTVFHIGDGFYSLNGRLVSVDKEAFKSTDGVKSGCPSYLTYALMPNVSSQMLPGALDFSFETIPMDQFDRLMIATDGVRFFLSSFDHLIPGKTSKVGSIDQLWDDSVFLKPFSLQRKLGLLNRDVHIPDWEGKSMLVSGSILKDDVTVVSVRRKR